MILPAKACLRFDVSHDLLLFLLPSFCSVVYVPNHRRPNCVLWGLLSFSTEAIPAAVVVSNCNIKTAVPFIELNKIEIYTIQWLIAYLCVFPHAP